MEFESFDGMNVLDDDNPLMFWDQNEDGIALTDLNLDHWLDSL